MSVCAREIDFFVRQPCPVYLFSQTSQPLVPAEIWEMLNNSNLPRDRTIGALGYERGPASMSVKNGFGGLGDLNDIRDPIADAAEMSVVVSLGGAIVLEGAGTLILMNGGRSLVNEGLQNYAVWRATTRGTISAADKVAIHEALTSALGQASALMAPYSATIQVEVQIAALAGAQISRQVAIVGSTVIRP